MRKSDSLGVVENDHRGQIRKMNQANIPVELEKLRRLISLERRPS